MPDGLHHSKPANTNESIEVLLRLVMRQIACSALRKTKTSHVAGLCLRLICFYPQQDSNLRFCLRRATLYPLSYGGLLLNRKTESPKTQAL